MRYLVHEAFKVLGESDWKSMIFFAAPGPTPAVPPCVGNRLSVLFTGLLAALGNEPETPAQRGLKPLEKTGRPGEDGHGAEPFPGSGVHQPGGSGRVGVAGRAGHLAPLQRRRLQLHRAAVCAAEGPALRAGEPGPQHPLRPSRPLAGSLHHRPPQLDAVPPGHW